MIEYPVVIPLARGTLARQELQGGEYLIADLIAAGPNAVLILPGWGGTRFGPQRILLQTAQALAEIGCTTLRLDFRGRGDSSGSSRATTLDSMIEDAVTAVNWLQKEQTAQRIILVGLCSGGNVALGAASLMPESIDQIICWSLLPFMEHKSDADHQGRDRKSFLLQMARKALRPESWAKLMSGEANVKGAVHVLAGDKEGNEEERQRKTSQRDILADLANFTGKMKLVYGSEDPEAKGSQDFYEAWCKKYRIEVDTSIIAGAPHNFFTARWTDEVIKQTVEWLR